jgi:hypothetical protein
VRLDAPSMATNSCAVLTRPPEASTASSAVAAQSTNMRSGDMALPHCGRQSGFPGARELAETAVAIAVRVDGSRPSHNSCKVTRPAQLAVRNRPVRLRPTILGRHERRRVEPNLQLLVRQPSAAVS